MTTPNNPTGQSIDLEELRAIADAAPGWSSSTRPTSSSRGPSAVELLEPPGHKLVVSRTMSKAFAFAGGRLGYLAAAPAVIDALMLVRLPYHLSALTQAAALAALGHADETLALVATLAASATGSPRAARSWAPTWCPATANFLLYGGFPARFVDAHAAWQAYLDAGVLVRDVGIPGICGSPSAPRRRTTASSRSAPRSWRPEVGARRRSRATTSRRPPAVDRAGHGPTGKGGSATRAGRGTRCAGRAGRPRRRGGAREVPRAPGRGAMRRRVPGRPRSPRPVRRSARRPRRGARAAGRPADRGLGGVEEAGDEPVDRREVGGETVDGVPGRDPGREHRQVGVDVRVQAEREALDDHGVPGAVRLRRTEGHAASPARGSAR